MRSEVGAEADDGIDLEPVSFHERDHGVVQFGLDKDSLAPPAAPTKL